MQKNNDKKIAFVQKTARIFPLLFILSMFILHLILPVKTFSKEERRYLAQWPVFHIERLFDGSYETKIESYFSDQFPFRNFWVYIMHTI